jgi:transposase
VTEDGIPFSYDIHSGSNADENTVLANMQKLQNLRAKLADYCEEPLLITGDRKTISDEIVIKYHKQDVQYLAPVTITEDNKEIALSVSDDEFDNNKLAYRDRSKGAYWAVFRPITFKLKNDRKSREKAIKRIESKLIHIESHGMRGNTKIPITSSTWQKNRLWEAERRNISLMASKANTGG